MGDGGCGATEDRRLEDPFGGKLHTSRSGDRLKVWSVGRDGVDHAGVGDWKPEAGKDILMEVVR